MTLFVGSTETRACGTWLTTEVAAGYGVVCESEDKRPETVARQPRWYEFATRAEARIQQGDFAAQMDFDAEPWDITCEAEGTSGQDAGNAKAQWDLAPQKTYRLVFYPREDGVALDAWYLAPPAVAPPADDLRLRPGDSDCPAGGPPESPTRWTPPGAQEGSGQGGRPAGGATGGAGGGAGGEAGGEAGAASRPPPAPGAAAPQPWAGGNVLFVLALCGLGLLLFTIVSDLYFPL